MSCSGPYTGSPTDARVAVYRRTACRAAPSDLLRRVLSCACDIAKRGFRDSRRKIPRPSVRTAREAFRRLGGYPMSTTAYPKAVPQLNRQFCIPGETGSSNFPATIGCGCQPNSNRSYRSGRGREPVRRMASAREGGGQSQSAPCETIPGAPSRIHPRGRVGAIDRPSTRRPHAGR